MFNATEVTIERFQQYLRESYVQSFGLLEPEFPNIIAFVARVALENIANSDAPYHDLEHTIRVTDCGQAILKGKHLLEGTITPSDWLHVTVALLCHDIGYVRGVVMGDKPGVCVINEAGDTVTPDDGATDASMAPYHVDRGILYIKNWFAHATVLDINKLVEFVEITRFPVPQTEFHQQTDSLAGLVRAADLIGQMGDLSYTRKTAALYNEMRETGKTRQPNYASAADLRRNYPGFFWNQIAPLIGPALRFLSVSQEGKMWTSVLYSHVFAEEHRMKTAR